MRSLLCLLISLLMVLSAATTTTKRVIKHQDAQSLARLAKAQAALQLVEERLQNYRALPPERRHEKEIALESSLKKAIQLAEDTKLLNKAHYFYANWQFHYGELEAVDPLLGAILRDPHLAYKNLALTLRAQVRLRQGRIAEAKYIAAAVSEKIPELGNFLALVQFHETIGQRAPNLETQNLTTGISNPHAHYPHTYMIYMFVELGNREHRWELERIRRELARPEYSNTFKLCVVSFDPQPLIAINGLTDTETSNTPPDLLWVNPGQEIDGQETAQAWRQHWALPNLPCSVLLGPGPLRPIMAVNPSLSTLRPLVGLKTEKPKAHQKKRLGWKGRNSWHEK